MKYEPVELTIDYFEEEDVLEASMGDNNVGELGGEDGGGIWGN